MVEHLKNLLGELTIVLDRVPNTERQVFLVLMEHLWPDLGAEEYERIWNIRQEAQRHAAKGDVLDKLTENLDLFDGILDEADVDVVKEKCKQYRENLKKTSSYLRPSRAGVISFTREDALWEQT